MMKRIVIGVLCLAVVGGTALATRNWRPEAPAAAGDRATTTADRSVGPNAAPRKEATDLDRLVEGNAAFACDLYQQLREADGNLFFSPYSISLALAMTYAGARGNTEKQMAEALHFALPQQRLHPAFRALRTEIASRGEHWRENEFVLRSADAIWPQKGLELLPSFLEVLKANYDSEVRALDFGGDPDGSRKIINDWASDQTKGKIRDLVPADLISADILLVLTDAIYLKALWQHPFDPEDTHPDSFHLLGGKDVKAEMMSIGWGYPYGEGGDYQAVEMPYLVDMSMVLVLPKRGRFASFERSLTAERLKGIIDGLEGREVRLTLPKFKYESAYRLRKPLIALGMVDAFGLADFSAMSGSALFILEVVHKARVGVDEKGTEAAAATAVMAMSAVATEGGPVEMKVDRPFIFLIRDNQTGAILFLGRVVDPRG